MQRTYQLSHMRKYRCDNRCCVDFINMTKLLISWYNRFDVSNLFDLNFWRIYFANEIRFANFEFWISYTKQCNKKNEMMKNAWKWKTNLLWWKIWQVKKNRKYAFKSWQHCNEKINWRDFCVVEKRKKNFTISNNYMKFTRCWWLRCKSCNNCKNWKILMIDKIKYNRFSLWKFEFSIDENYRI